MTLKQKIVDLLNKNNFDVQKVYREYDNLILDNLISCEKESYKRIVRKVRQSLQGTTNNNQPNSIQIDKKIELNDAELSSKSSRIKTLDDLIRESQIDLKIWKIDRYVVNKWEVGSNVDGVIVTEPLFQVKAWLSKIIPDEAKFPIIKKVNIPIQKKLVNETHTKKDVKRSIVIADHQVGFLKDIRTNILTPFHDRKVMDIQMQVVADYQPDEIILAGDILDCTEASKYTKLPEFYYTLQPALNETGWFLSKLRELSPNSKIVMLNGNHESYAKGTEILTDVGYIPIEDVTLQNKVAQYDIHKKTVIFKEPKKVISHFSDKVIDIEADSMRQVVTLNHEVIYNGEKIFAKDLLIKDDVKQGNFPLYFNRGFDCDGIDLSDDWIRLLTWVVCDGCVPNLKKYAKNPEKSIKSRVQFKLSHTKKIDEIERILKRLNIAYTKNISKKSGENKLQPYVIIIYGENARVIIDKLNGVKVFPDYFKNISREQSVVFYEAILKTDGHYKFGSMTYSSISPQNIEVVSSVFQNYGYIIINKVRAEFSKKSFNKNPLYTVKIKNNDSRIMAKTSIVEKVYNDDTFCVEVDSGAIVTRYDGKVGISGNCRLQKYIMENMLFAYNLKPYNRDTNVMSLRNLLSLDNIDVELIEEYPAGAYWINNWLKVIHGEYLSVGKELSMTDVSVIMGHLHRIEQVSKTIHGKSEHRAISVNGVGCSCRVDGIVPGMNSKPNWQQGFIKVESTENSFNIQNYYINDGKCLFDNKYYEGVDYRDKIKNVIYFSDD